MTFENVDTGWVIERGGGQPALPTYWAGLSGVSSAWSQDHMDAVRFMRRQDAEKVACSIGGTHYIVEHAWVKP